MNLLENIKKQKLKAIKQKPINERKRYHELKESIKEEFKKISENDEFNKSIDEIFKVNVYYKDSKYINTELYCDNNDYSCKIVNFINSNIKKFNNERYRDYNTYIDNDKELASFLNWEFKRAKVDCIYWCFYICSWGEHIFISDQGSYSEMIIIRLNKEKLSTYFNFNGYIHPFIENLERQLNTRIADRNYDEVYKRALANMDKIFYEHMNDLNKISLLKYEGECNKGILIYSDRTNENVWNISLKFHKAIKINEYKKIRKLLEVSGEGNALLLNENFEAFAFGNIRDGQDNYTINFIEELTWKVSKNNEDYIIMSKFQPLLPSKNCDSEEIIETLKEVFHYNGNDSIERLVNIINEVKQQKKGTMLVITENAEEESKRLISCGIKVNPTEIRSEIIQLVTSIDGALLLDEKGICYSIGVILDGEEIGDGDSARGARYNSALRYYKKQERENKKCVILVISEDGYINSIP